jgi:hypothetical protein
VVRSSSPLSPNKAKLATLAALALLRALQLVVEENNHKTALQTLKKKLRALFSKLHKKLPEAEGRVVDLVEQQMDALLADF